MIHVEDGKIIIKGDFLEIAEDVGLVMDALNVKILPVGLQGKFFWGSLFTLQTEEGKRPAMEFVQNLNIVYDIFCETVKGERKYD